MQRVRDYGVLKPEWDVYITSLPSRFIDIYVEEEEDRLQETKGSISIQGNNVF